MFNLRFRLFDPTVNLNINHERIYMNNLWTSQTFFTDMSWLPPRFRAFSELEGKPANQWTRTQPVDCGECYAVHQRHWPSAWTPRRPLPQTCKWRIKGPLKLGLLHFYKSLTKFKVIKNQGMEKQQLQYSQL